MEKVFICAINNLCIVKAASAMLDFVSLTHLLTHTTYSLKQKTDILKDFYWFKDAFKATCVCQHFNIAKIHSMMHYVEAIKSHGTADVFNSELHERLHIEFAKKGYRTSNKRKYDKQMVKWVEQHNSIAMFSL